MHSRRKLLHLLGTGLGSAALAGCATQKGWPGAGSDGALDSGDPAGGDGGDTGGTDGTWSSGSGDPLADTGPDLADRVPGSLTRCTPGDLDLELTLLSGALPDDWHGHLWLVHANPYEDGSAVFLGDGQIVRVDLTPSAAHLKRRMARTPCQIADQAVQGTTHAFENQGLARLSMSLGVRNFANTSVVPMGDRILLGFDAGRPWEIDPDTLEIASAVGWNSEWRSALPDWLSLFVHWPFPLLMSTAHPAVDPDTGALYSVAYGIELMGMPGFAELVRWDGHGALERWQLMDEMGLPVTITQSVHQMALTRDHVVLADTSFLVEIDLLSEGETQAQAPDTVLWIVPRNQLTAGQILVTAKRLVVPREVVHFLADYDDSDGIVLHVAHNPGADASEFLEAGDTRGDTWEGVRSDLLGVPAAPTDLGAFARYVVNPSTATIVDSIVVYDERLWGGPALVAMPGPALPDRVGSTWWSCMGMHPELRLSRLETLYSDHPYRHVAMGDLPNQTKPATLVRIDPDTAEVADSYAFPSGRVGLSPTFVPRQGGGAEDGYLVCTVISDDTDTVGSSGDELWVFDAHDLEQGPLARLGHDQLEMPFTLHTAWTPRANRRTAPYAVDVRADHEDQVWWLDAELKDLFEREIYPAF